MGFSNLKPHKKSESKKSHRFNKHSNQAKHFLHITKHKYKEQFNHLQELFNDNKYLVEAQPKSKELTKYWRNAPKLFSRFNTHPIYMTHELWYSVTPEKLASFLAKFVQACLPNAKRILDVFCGGGGNTIQFAKLFPKVYGVDMSIEHLYCTYKNAITYEVQDRIWLKYGNWLDMARKDKFKKLNIDCVFASPPWGGPNFSKQKVYNLETSLIPAGLTELLEGFLKISPNVIMFLPRNSNLEQISRTTRAVLGADALCKVVYMKEDGYLKAICCFWGKAFTTYDTDDKQNKIDTVDLNYDIDG